MKSCGVLTPSTANAHALPLTTSAYVPPGSMATPRGKESWASTPRVVTSPEGKETR